MGDDNEGVNRRTVIQRGSLILSGMIGASGVASANPGRGDGRGRGRSQNGPPFEIELKDGRLILKKNAPNAKALEKAEAFERKKAKAHDVHRGPNTERGFEKVIREFNQAAESGKLEFEEEDDTVRILINESGGDN